MRQNAYDYNELKDNPRHAPPLDRLHHVHHRPHPVHPQKREGSANYDQWACLFPHLHQQELLGQQTYRVDDQEDRMRPLDGYLEPQLRPVVVHEEERDVYEVYEVADEECKV